jgi:hypothetical protein
MQQNFDLGIRHFIDYTIPAASRQPLSQQFSVWLKTGPVSRLRAARLSRSFRQTRKTGPV